MLKSLVAGYEKESKCQIYLQDLEIGTNFYSRAHVIIKISPQSIEKIPGRDNNNVFHCERIDKETMDIINELIYQLTK